MFKVLFLILVSNITYAQMRADTHVNSYLIFFNKSAVLPVGPPALSKRSLDRKLAHGICIDQADYVVPANYLHCLQPLVSRLYEPSRWLQAVAVEASEAQMQSIAGLSFVHHYLAMPAGSTQVSATGSIMEAGNLSSDAQLNMLGLDRLHASGYTGKGQLIAMFDNGFSNINRQPAFTQVFKENRILAARNYVHPGVHPYETGSDGEHGARCFSLIAALQPPNFTGAAYDASFMLAVTEDMGSEGIMEEYFWLLASEWADSMGADIISSSLGYSTHFTYGTDHLYLDLNGHTTLISVAANMAASKGILVVNAAGNEGTEPWRHIIAPADADSCLAVGAVDADQQYVAFSSQGPTFDQRIKPDVAAMGYQTVTLLPSGPLKAGSGTSFACPLVAGFAACLHQANNNVGNMALFAVIKQSASHAAMPDTFTGWGVPAASAAYLALTGKTLSSLPLHYENELTIIPNPVHADFTIRFYLNAGPVEGRLYIYNMLGEEVKNIAVSLTSGYNYFSSVTNNIYLEQGVYNVLFTGTGFGKTVRNKILVR